MTRLTQEQLIEQIKELKGIKPNKEWASLLKSQILAEQQPQVVITAQKARFTNAFSFIFAPRKLVYSLAVILFLIVGVFGFATYTVPGDLLFPVKKIAEQSQATLSGQTTLKQDVARLSNRINDLAQVAKDNRTGNIPSAISEINGNVAELTKNLKDNTADSATIKEIAASLKTLANVPGTDLTANPDVKDLYQTVVQSQIADLKNTTLTDDQQATLSDVEFLYARGEYVAALEEILLINN